MREGGCNPAKINDPIIELLLSSRGELSISFPGIGRGETKGRGDKGSGDRSGDRRGETGE